MAFYLQLRSLKRDVQRQLGQDGDVEKVATPSTAGSDPESETPTASPPYKSLPGIERRKREDGSEYLLVSFHHDDPHNPHQWAKKRRLLTTFLVWAVAFGGTAASAIDSSITVEAAQEFQVSEVVEAFGNTGIFLTGFGAGSLLNSPLSELVGRFPTYLGGLVVFCIWLVASAVAPNIGAQMVFRFLAGFCGSAPLTVAGGSIADMFNPKEKTWAFPLFGVGGFGGPLLGPVIGAYIGKTGVLNWRWVEWIMLILNGLILVLVLGLMEETLGPRILKYRAYYLRKLTGDDRFMTEQEARGETTLQIMRRNFGRPFVLATEPIVLLLTFYLAIVYIVLFTFLDGYETIFQQTYGISSGLTFIIFTAMFIGVLGQIPVVFLVYRRTVKQLARDGDTGQGLAINRESRLMFAMIGAPFIPIGLFWMGWTAYPSISIWSPILASVAIGFGIMSIFLSTYMYIIDSYEVFAASALTFNALTRYLAAGGMVAVGVPMYGNLGTHYTLTILACISAAVVPIPYALHRWGPHIRARSKFAHGPGK